MKIFKEVDTCGKLLGFFYNEKPNNRNCVEISEIEFNFICCNKERDADISSIDTPYYAYKMQQEGIYDDYITYRDELHIHGQEQKLIEQQRQESYQQALENNPELSYEDWLSVQPMQMPIQREPVPSKELIAFKEKWLG